MFAKPKNEGYFYFYTIDDFKLRKIDGTNFLITSKGYLKIEMTEQILTLRQANENDKDYLLWLRQETMTEHILNSGLETSTEKHWERINYEFNESKIILLGDKAIGLLKSKKEDKKIEIIQIQIEPKFQRRGFGQDILNVIIKEADKNNLIITLSVLKSNPARNLYKRMGFEIFKEDKYSYIMIRQNNEY